MTKPHVRTCANREPNGTHRVDLEILDPHEPKRHLAAWYLSAERARHVANFVGSFLVRVGDERGNITDSDIADAIHGAASITTYVDGHHVYL